MSNRFFMCSSPPFTTSFLNETGHSVPECEPMPTGNLRMQFPMNAENGNIVCSNGYCVVRSEWIEGVGVLSNEFAQERMAEVAYFIDRLPKYTSSELTRVRAQMMKTRQTGGICSFLDLLRILVQGALYKSDILVKPRLKMMLELFSRPSLSASTKQYTEYDVAKISQLTYISLTITVLAWIFGGEPSSMLVFDKEIMSGTAIALSGHDFWRFVHFCVPSFGWYFADFFSKCFVTTFQRPPQFFQYSTGEEFATVIWLAFQQYYTIVKKACMMYCEKNPQIHDKRARSEPQWLQFLMLSVPSPLSAAKIEEFEASAAKIQVSAQTLYACKSMVEFSVISNKK